MANIEAVLTRTVMTRDLHDLTYDIAIQDAIRQLTMFQHDVRRPLLITVPKLRLSPRIVSWLSQSQLLTTRILSRSDAEQILMLHSMAVRLLLVHNTAARNMAALLLVRMGVLAPQHRL